ncbi:hypothetical protein CYMTET_34323, partial [Cymbomonas tetramitiformis]
MCNAENFIGCERRDVTGNSLLCGTVPVTINEASIRVRAHGTELGRDCGDRGPDDGAAQNISPEVDDHVLRKGKLKGTFSGQNHTGRALQQAGAPCCSWTKCQVSPPSRPFRHWVCLYLIPLTTLSSSPPTASPTASSTDLLEDVADEVTIAAVSVGMATAAPTDGNLLAQLQFFSMCVYLVLDDKPDILMRAGRQVQWVNFHGSWPMANGDTEECEPEWEDFAYAYIPEAEEAKAWGTMVNTWVAVGCLYAAISAVQIGLHAFCNTSLPTLRAFLGFPR